MAGIEPATDGLRNRCSTAELHWLQGSLKEFLVEFAQKHLNCVTWATFPQALTLLDVPNGRLTFVSASV